MKLENEIRLDYSDVLIRPKRSTLGSRKEVDLNRIFTYRNYDAPDQIHFDGVPIMASNMDGVGTFEMADALSEQHLLTCLVKTYSREELIDFYDPIVNLRTEFVAMSIGITEADFVKLVYVKAKVGTNLKYLCMDVANGYSSRFAQQVKKVRDHFPDLVIIAGNVVTREMTEELILNGADIVKVGIGPGSVCTTRVKTGVGFPQLSAVIDCADAAHGLGGHIIADGGCSTPGDVAKAFAAGADFVMLGGMFAGHDQGGGEVIDKYYKTGEWIKEETTVDKIVRTVWKDAIERKQFVKFYGMSSKSANDKHFGGLSNYRSSEGRTVLTKYKGCVNITIQDILGGIRSTCTYAGAAKLKDLSKCTTFIRCGDTHNRVFESATIGN